MTIPPLITLHAHAAATAPVVHLAPANGFPVETYAPVTAALADHARVVAVPPRPLWPEPPPVDSLTHWRDFAADMRAGFDAYGLTAVIAIGHSLGGIVSMIAAAAQPARFRALVLLDPVILPLPYLRAMRQMTAAGTIDAAPLVSGSLRRRFAFASPAKAFDYWRGKRLFADWPDAVLRLYVEHGLIAAAGGYTLRWSPEWEAQVFRRGDAGQWTALRRLPHLPILLVRGGTSDTLTPDCLARIRRLRPDVEVVEVPGHGHLFPQSAPTEAGQIIGAWLDQRQLLGHTAP